MCVRRTFRAIPGRAIQYRSRITGCCCCCSEAVYRRCCSVNVQDAKLLSIRRWSTANDIRRRLAASFWQRMSTIDDIRIGYLGLQQMRAVKTANKNNCSSNGTNDTVVFTEKNENCKFLCIKSFYHCCIGAVVSSLLCIAVQHVLLDIHVTLLLKCKSSYVMSPGLYYSDILWWHYNVTTGDREAVNIW